MKKIILLVILGVFSFNAQSQTMKQRVADRLYDELSFFKAVELYQDLAKKDDATAYLVRRTAECYRFLGDSKNSEIWYEKLVNIGSDVKADDYYHYAQMLKMNEKYELANEMMAKFKSMSSGNSIASAHTDNASYVEELKSNPDRYSIAIMNKKVNTEDSDFAPNYLTVDGITKLTFASSRKNMAMLNKDFQWDGSHFLDVYVTKLGGDGESTEVNRFDRGIKSKYHEGPVSFSNNGKKMYLTRSNYLDRKKGLDSARHNNLKLYLSEKNDDGEWSELKEFPYSSDNYSLGHATVTEDGKTMYFSSDMPGGKGVTDIWKSTLVNEEWTKPVNVEAVNTEGREMFPFIGKEGILYLASDGHAGLGGLDLYRALPAGEEFAKPMNMGFPLNTSRDDFAMIINEDETEGYFSSNRKGDDVYGSDDIYRFKVLDPFTPPTFIVKGCALVQGTENTIAGVEVNLINTENNAVFATVITQQDGCYEFKELPEGNYKVEGNVKDYSFVSGKSFSTEDCRGGIYDPANTIFKKRDCGLLGTIVDKLTKEPISGATVIMVDKNNGKTQTFTTDEKGQFTDPLQGYDCPGGLLSYDVTIAKDGYTPNKVEFTKAITKSGIVNFDGSLFKEGGEVTVFCNIEPLLYDFDKSYIRADAAIELDKLVQCMRDNPEMIVEIGSHTDCRASRRYNQRLSERRAKSAREYVISKGIEPYRIFGKGYGEDRLLNGCACEPTNKSDCSDEEHQANRRTEFRIVAGGDNVQNGSTDSF